MKAYLRGVWDSVKGVSLIFIVIRDTYSHTEIDQNNVNKPDAEVDDSSSSSNNATISANKSRIASRRQHSNKRELNKLKEYVNCVITI